MENFSFERICALLRYDWTLNKRKFMMTSLIVLLAYIVLAFVFFLVSAELGVDTVNASLPNNMVQMWSLYFATASSVMFIVVTTLLTEKFCYSRSATAYLSLPGTSLEKYCVMAVEYFIGLVSVQFIGLVMFLMTMGLGFLCVPELDWNVNYFANVWPYIGMDLDKLFGEQLGEQLATIKHSTPIYLALVQQLKNLEWISSMMEPVDWIASVALHGVICMFFKSNVQVKAILLELLLLVAFVIVLIVLICGWAGYAKMNNLGADYFFGSLDNLIAAIKYYVYLTPVLAAAFCYIFYRQLRCKQAK